MENCVGVYQRLCGHICTCVRSRMCVCMCPRACVRALACACTGVRARGGGGGGGRLCGDESFSVHQNLATSVFLLCAYFLMYKMSHRFGEKYIKLSSYEMKRFRLILFIKCNAYVSLLFLFSCVASVYFHCNVNVSVFVCWAVHVFFVYAYSCESVLVLISL